MAVVEKCDACVDSDGDGDSDNVGVPLLTS